MVPPKNACHKKSGQLTAVDILVPQRSNETRETTKNKIIMGVRNFRTEPTHPDLSREQHMLPENSRATELTSQYSGKTQLAEVSSIKEEGGGCTFSWKGPPPPTLTSPALPSQQL